MTPFHLIFTEFDDLISIQSKEIGKNQNHPNLNFHDEILKIANNWLKNTPDEKNSIRHSENKLIQPLLTLIAKELEWKQSDYAFKLSKVMRDLKLEILQWDSAKGYNFRSLITFDNLNA